MRIALNGRFSGRSSPTGMQRSSYTLASALFRHVPQVTWVALGDFGSSLTQGQSSARVDLEVVPWARLGRLRAQIYEQLALSRRARNRKCNILLNPMQTCPYFHFGVRQVVTVHDLNFLHHPEWFGRAFRWWNRFVTIPAIRRADHVVAISDYVLEDVRRTLGVAVCRSSRIYNVGPQPRKMVGKIRARPLSILCVNAFQPHKNLPRVIKAFEELRREIPELQLRLVGKAQDNFAAMPELAGLDARAGVIVLGYVSDQILAEEYASCSVFCYPSLAEGFGLPVLEAAAGGALVVTSNATCLPEITGGTAILVEPESIESIRGGLKKALTMPPLERDRLVARSIENLARFTPEKVADGYAKIFTSIVRSTETGASSTRRVTESALTRRT